MTRALLPLSMFVAIGCSGGDLRFEHASQLVVHTDGVAMSKTGQVSMASMFGTTCLIETNSGMIGTDYDVPTSDSETVEDVNNEDIVLVRSEGGVHLVSPFGGDLEFTEYDGNGIEPSDVNSQAFTNADVTGTVHGARFAAEGLVLLTRDRHCSVDWFDFHSDTVDNSVEIDESWCRSDVGFAVDRAGDVVYLAGAQGIEQVSADGISSVLAGPVRDVSWSASNDAIFAAQSDEVVATGSVEWRSQLAGPVAAVEVLGDRDVIAAMVDLGETGELVLLDALTGATLYRVDTPDVANNLTASQDGSSLAVELTGEVHFFRVK